MKNISEQGTDCYISKFYQSFVFFYIDKPKFCWNQQKNVAYSYIHVQA